MEMGYVLGYVIIGCVTGMIGLMINEKSGFGWGFFLGPIGWIIAALDKPKTVVVQAPQPKKESKIEELEKRIAFLEAKLLNARFSGDEKELRYKQ